MQYSDEKTFRMMQKQKTIGWKRPCLFQQVVEEEEEDTKEKEKEDTENKGDTENAEKPEKREKEEQEEGIRKNQMMMM
eukprot:1682203-Ditylum_brightwellii.AAC.1